MSMEEFLLNVPVFSDLSQEDLKLIPILLKPFNAIKGTVLFEQGSPGDGMYVLENGSVALSIHTFTGEWSKQQIVNRHGIFGQLSLFDDIPHNTRAEVIEDATGYFLPTEQFRYLTLVSDKTMMLSLQRGFTKSLSQLVDEKCHHLIEKEKGFAVKQVRKIPEFEQMQSVEKQLNIPLINRFRCFHYYTPCELEALTEVMQQREVPNHEIIFDEHLPADSCFFVARGATRILSEKNGSYKQLAVLGPGTIIHQRGPHGSILSNLACSAVEKCLLYELKKNDFESLYFDDSLMGWKLIRHYNEGLVALARTFLKL